MKPCPTPGPERVERVPSCVPSCVPSRVHEQQRAGGPGRAEHRRAVPARRARPDREVLPVERAARVPHRRGHPGVAGLLAVPAADQLVAPAQPAAVGDVHRGRGDVPAAGGGDQRLRQPAQPTPRRPPGRRPRPGTRRRSRRAGRATRPPSAHRTAAPRPDLDLQAQLVTAQRTGRAADQVHLGRRRRRRAGAAQQQRRLAAQHGQPGAAAPVGGRRRSAPSPASVAPLSLPSVVPFSRLERQSADALAEGCAPSRRPGSPPGPRPATGTPSAARPGGPPRPGPSRPGRRRPAGPGRSC